jgi:hypothetical protein
MFTELALLIYDIILDTRVLVVHDLDQIAYAAAFHGKGF